MTRPDVVVHPQPSVLAAATAARLVTKLVDVQAAGSIPSLVLTGGRDGIAVLRQLAALPAASALDWRRVDLFWGDERYVPAADDERNEAQAREALLDHVPVAPERVHPMGAAGGESDTDPDAAARRYEQLLAEHAAPEDHGPVPTFDVCLLGIGEEGHVGSIFPESPAVYEVERAVVGVRGSPKPPPTRVTMTLPAIRSAAEVWFVVSGQAKATAVAMSLSGAGEIQVPAAGARGRRRTLWLLDRAAAAKLPPGLAPRLS